MKAKPLVSEHHRS